MRLIDADKFSREMYHEAFETDSDLQKWDSGCWIRYKMFENKLKEQPTIDAVVHGHWKHIFGGFVECSNCGEFPLLDGERKYVESEYCPCCGAKMDEVTE